MHLDSKFQKLGEDTYRVFGFRVYQISLWTEGHTWDPKKPYALELHYLRSVSKDMMVDTIMDNITDQNVADDATLARWKDLLDSAIPDVEDGDTLMGLASPGKETLLSYNGVQVATIQDEALSTAFFNIWLGKDADEDMRSHLLGTE